VTESTETTSSNRVAFSKKVRTLAIGALATAALSVSAVSAVGSVSHDAGRQQPVRVSPASHRLALTLHVNSVRLT
jgi:hypothetical protein